MKDENLLSLSGKYRIPDLDQELADLTQDPWLLLSWPHSVCYHDIFKRSVDCGPPPIHDGWNIL